LEGIVYLNEEFLPAGEARVSAFDRGFLFGDGVYEVIPVVESTLIDEDYFFERLQRSTSELSLGWPCTPEQLLEIIHELVVRNRISEGYVYLQITRGAAPRDFAFPLATAVTLFGFASQRNILTNPLGESGVDVVTVEDLRWKRRDIKSINLLAQCMAKQHAVEQGAFEAWMVEGGMVTEGSSSSAFIVKQNTLITRPLSNDILPGIRRRVILELAQDQSLDIEQRSFSVSEALDADEAFLSSATTLVLPVRSIDGKNLGAQLPGPITQKVRELYIANIMKTVRTS
jgi:D-alanine transaminase